jgi:hypothetical protein
LKDFEERTVSNKRCSALGSSDAAAATSAAWASLNSPSRNASAVAGRSSRRRAVSNVRAAAPTVTPVADASKCATERCSDFFQQTACSIQRADRPWIEAR